MTIHVTIVAAHGATIEELRRYLDELGMSVEASREAALAQVAERSCAVVLFPDDFALELARTFVTALRAARPELLVVIVTREPHALAAAIAADGVSAVPLVLPRPTFGWTIVDAIRAHVPEGAS